MLEFVTLRSEFCDTYFCVCDTHFRDLGGRKSPQKSEKEQVFRDTPKSSFDTFLISFLNGFSLQTTVES